MFVGQKFGRRCVSGSDLVSVLEVGVAHWLGLSSCESLIELNEGSTFKMTDSHGCWVNVSVPCCADLPIGLGG